MSNGLFSTTQKMLSPDLTDLITQPAQIGGIQKRNLSSYINPEQGDTTYNSNTIVRFKFPSECIDFTNSSLQFGVTTAVTGGTYARVSQNIGSVIRRLRLLFGSTEVYDTENFNLLFSYMTLYKNTNWFNGLGKLLMGTGSASDRNSANNNGQKYLLRLGCICEILNRVLPLHVINEQFIIELTLEKPENCIETDGSNPSFSLFSVEYHFDYLILEPEFNNLLKEQIVNGGLCIPFRKYNNYTNTSVTSGVTSAQIQLPYRYLALQGIISIMRNSANLGNPTVNDKFVTYLGYSNFVNTVLKVNSVLMPADKVNNVNEVMELDLQLFSKKYYDDVYIANNFPQYFSMGFSLMQDSRDYSFSTLQGISASTSGFSLIHQFVLSSNSVNMQIDYYSISAGSLLILPTGSIKFTE